MKKLLITMLSVIAALSLVLTSVYAAPAEGEAPATEQAAPAEEAAPAEGEAAPATDGEKLPVEKEQKEVEIIMTLNVKLDGSSDFTFKQSVTDDIYNYYQQSKDQVAASYEQMGMKLDIKDEGGKKFINISSASQADDPISFSSRGATDTSYRFGSIKGFFGTKYFVTSGFDMRQGVAETPDENANIMAQLVMNLPVGAAFSDADDKVSGNKVLTWNIKEGQSNPVTVMFTIPNITNIAILLGLLIVLILVIVFIVLGKRKSKLTDAEIIDGTVGNIEGETEEDGDVEDPFADMTDEEIESDIEAEPDVEDAPADEEKTEE